MPPTWDVFDADGTWTTQLRMPAGLTVVDIGSDYVLGVRRDELDVAYLRMHRLVRN